VKEAMEISGIHFELLCVDDGSTDGSFDELRRLAEDNPFLRAFRLSRNFGQQAGIVVGLKNSRGEYIAVIDDDLQDPPELLPGFFEKLYGEADVVYGVRKKRKEGFLKRIVFSLFYRLLNFFAAFKMPLDAGDFCAMRKPVVEAILQFMESEPYLRGIRSWVGFRQVGVEYQRGVRLEGESGYTLAKYIKLASAGIFSFSNFPIYLIITIGLVIAGFAFCFGLYVFIYYWITHFNVPGYVSLILFITLMGGFNLVAIGTVGLYIARINSNTKKWPVALVAEIVPGEKK
jgi:dolichol-phosphate mannosyltransferase